MTVEETLFMTAVEFIKIRYPVVRGGYVLAGVTGSDNSLKFIPLERAYALLVAQRVYKQSITALLTKKQYIPRKNMV